MINVTVVLEGRVCDVKRGLVDALKELGEPTVTPSTTLAVTVTTPNVVVLAELIHAVRADSKIQAIKAIRSLTNLGLRESKDLVDSVWLRAPETY
jgi:ribosomal protein L7/L12